METFSRDDFEYTATLLRSEDSKLVTAALSNNYNVILAALDRAVVCCRTTPLPGPWKAGVADAADPPMVNAMVAIRDRLSYRTPLSEFIGMLKAAAQIDSRTWLGGNLQRCLLHNAAARLELIGSGIYPYPWAGWRWRLRDAWAVFRRRAVALTVRN